MPTAPTLAKLTRPQAAGLIPRTRLFDELDAAQGGGAVWVSAPAGAGKTSLVASWLESRAVNTLWYQVDPGDSDLPTFFHYLGQGAPGAGREQPALPHLTPEYLHGVPVFARRYFETLYTRLSPPFALVFDNYQEVPADAALHPVLDAALNQMPAGGVLLTLSRQGVPRALARWVADNRTTLIGWDKLRLTEDETRALAARHGVSHEALLSQLSEKSGGWAAALMLLLRARPAGVSDDLPSAGETLVFDYLAGEVLAGVPPEHQEFLLKTALLPSMSPDMATALTGLPQAEKLLYHLHRAQFFTDRRHLAPRTAGEAPVAVYQYHPLLREFLLAQLDDTLPADELRALKGEAAGILDRHGQTEAALELLKDIGDWDALARVIAGQAPRLLREGRNRVLDAWITALPDATLAPRPGLHYCQGMARLPLSPPRARESLTRAYQAFRAADDAENALLACAGAMQSYYFEWGSFVPVDAWVAEIEYWLARAPEIARPLLPRLIGMAGNCLTKRQPQHPLAEQWADLAVTSARAGGAAAERLQLATYALHYFIWGGDFKRAGGLIEEFGGLSESDGMPPAARLQWLAANAFFYWLDARHEKGYAAVETGLALAASAGVHVMDFLLHTYGLHTALSAGDAARARQYLDGMRASLDAGRLVDVEHFHFTRACVAWLEGRMPADLDAVGAHLTRLEALGSEALTPAWRIQYAQLRAMNGEAGVARAQLGLAAPQVASMRSCILEYQSHLIHAYVCLREGETESVRAHLRAGLAVAREQGYCNFHPYWQPEMMAPLYAAALEAGIEPDYVRGMIRRRGLVAPSVDVETWPWPIQIYALGRFELVRDGERLQAAGKGQQRPLELLQALLGLGGRRADAERLTQLLWEDSEADAAQSTFDSTLHRLRKLLGHADAILLQNGKLSLNDQLVWTDIWAFERLLGRLDAAPGPAAPGLAAQAEAFDKALKLYQGPFLGNEADAPWVLPRRERLRSKFLRAVERHGGALDGRGDHALAADVYRRALELEPLSEELYRRLMRVQLAQGQHAEALNTYRRCRELLSVVLGLAPDAETQALYRKIHAP